MTAPRSAGILPSALDHAAEIAGRLTALPSALFLDYDGTLSPIARRPEEAVLDPDVRALVARLADRWPVAVVSGRDLEDVRTLVGLREIAYAGCHGLDIAGPAGSAVRREIGLDHLPALDRITQILELALAGIPGARLERKRFTLAVHFRLVTSDHRPRVAAAVDAALADSPALRKTTGKAVFEIRPRTEWDKGHAVRWMREQTTTPAQLAVYVGDDDTDEDAFRTLGFQDAGIIVGGGSRRTYARYGLADPGEVARFLAETLRLAGAAAGALVRWR